MDGHEDQWEVGSPARRYCSCLDKVWRGSGDAEGGGNGQVRFSEREPLGIANYLNSCQEYWHFKRGCLGNCRLPSGREEMYFRQGKAISSSLPSCLPECKHLAAHNAEASKRFWWLGVHHPPGTLLGGLSWKSSSPENHCLKLSRGGHGILSQGQSLS